MSRYIDADALKNKITELDGGSAIDGTGFDIYTCEVFELIDEIPVADVVEVVRCKDCKWFDSQKDFCHNPRWGNGWANYPPPTVIEERFCCDGERREDEEIH